jgi:molybdate/tungstate transport system substrate-binding protein
MMTIRAVPAEHDELHRRALRGVRRARRWHGAPRIAIALIAASAATGRADVAGGVARRVAAAGTGPEVTLVEFGAGTLAVPFKAVNSAFHAVHPEIDIRAQFGGSVKMAKQITELHQPADLLAVADYHVIPQQLQRPGGQDYATWYVGFASNAITFVYTDHSKGAARIDAANWYEVLSEPGVEIGRSNPDTDPSGYQTLQALQLAERHYQRPGLASAILRNAPRKNIRDTETELIGALEAGQLDYLAIYRSDALQHGFKYLRLPREIDLSDPALATEYSKVSVETKNGRLTGRPIIYAVTVLSNARHPDAALTWTRFLLGADGRAVMRANGFSVLEPALASGMANLPADVRTLVSPWPGS